MPEEMIKLLAILAALVVGMLLACLVLLVACLFKLNKANSQNENLLVYAKAISNAIDDFTESEDDEEPDEETDSE